ncbi:LytR/AlgR family response regulator transcription factor [Spirosoma aerolatum]|uniref:LytR/AlgR family response regulator transcription factor n=1 Tax=Spirosoma aerolatum TaxID=1211326 RepID=UPI0009AC9091|nr:LytTR family DNA-binding domain-containing protein [Spirosoma aerolatum]
MIVYIHQPASNPAELLSWPPLRVYSSDSGAKWRAVADLMYLRGEANYTWLYWSSDPPVLVPYTLKRVEAKLPSAWFTRTHRHYVVNQRFMDRIELGNASAILHLTNGAALPISRRRWSLLRREWAGLEETEIAGFGSRSACPAVAPRLTIFPPEKNLLTSILLSD